MEYDRPGRMIDACRPKAERECGLALRFLFNMFDLNPVRPLRA